MLKKTLLLSAIAATCCMSVNGQNYPKLGVDPIDKVIDAMTLDEKLDMVIGAAGVETDASATVGSSAELVPGAAGQLNAIPRLGIPAIVVADGPAGVRINPTREGTKQTFYCTHFPVATVVSSTWNTELANQIGKAMGDETRHYGVDVLLAPATNIMRNPLNGRNFEYYSEDPLLAGKICAAVVNGVQSNGVGTSVKHFALNNQETNRTSNNVIGSPRTFREIYLKPFEIVVKEAQPWTIMTSYNKINGTMTSERADLVTEILRHEWGFKGMVMTDWFGGQYAAAQMQAGNDLLMPGKKTQRDELKKAIINGHLSMEIIDRNIRHILQCIMMTPAFKGLKADNNPDLKAHAVVTRNAATEGMVLLKNDGNVLPLEGSAKKVAVFGRTAYDFIAGGTGSGDVNHAYVISLTEGLKNAGMKIDKSVQKAYEKYIPAAKAAMPDAGEGLRKFMPKDLIDEMQISDDMLDKAAKGNDMAIITIGKTSGEFLDRKLSNNFNLTQAEQNMISGVCDAFHKAGKKVVVILNVCGPIETASWTSKPDAILNVWLPGQEGGNSVADVLTGKECPSGRLPMTWPLTYNDVNNKADFPMPDEISDEMIDKAITGFADKRTTGTTRNFDYTEYNEGVYVGYRYYTTKNVNVAYPFGYGLSYTTFEKSAPETNVNADGDITVKVNVKNVGKTAGKEVVEVYVSAPGKDMDKPARELKGFAKTRKLAPGETQTVEITIPYESLASFNEKDSRWQVEGGEYKVMVADNAADAAPLTATVSEKAGVTETVRPCLLPEMK
ncbi:glycoside hydrolase family 3 C-terminal domain-containing protein [Prevotella sp.]|uniref:glycoside hydrolase family 3 C-terminal domain-containing protein n=1 Tax=Prevotella sp. TaxID=59823 RepID=UPI003AB2EDF1